MAYLWPMARGEPTKQTIIGHTLYGDHNGYRCKYHVSITDNAKALKHGEGMGLTDIKAYPIYKDEKTAVSIL